MSCGAQGAQAGSRNSGFRESTQYSRVFTASVASSSLLPNALTKGHMSAGNTASMSESLLIDRPVTLVYALFYKDYSPMVI